MIGQAPCNQGSIRLQGGTSTSGRVEVCHINVWGKVCGDSSWGRADAQVACRQLGLPTTGASTHTLSSYNVSAVSNGTQVSWLRYVRCVGTESSLFNCPHDITWINYCFQSDAEVRCQDSKSYLNIFNVS